MKKRKPLASKPLGIKATDHDVGRAVIYRGGKHPSVGRITQVVSGSEAVYVQFGVHKPEVIDCRELDWFNT